MVRMKKKTFAGVIFGIAFLLMVGISAAALWMNDVISPDRVQPAVSDNAGDTTLYPALDDNEKWGYVNASGDWVVPAEYDDAELFLGDMAWVCQDSKWGAINTKGQLIVSCTYDNKYYIDSNLYKISVAVSGQARSVFNAKGEKILGLENGEVGSMDGGLIAFSRNIDEVNHWGYIDTEGKVVIAPSYKSVGDVGLTHAVVQTFDDEMLLVSRSDGTETELPDNVDLHGLGSNMQMYVDKDKFGYLDMNGKAAIPAQFISAEAFSNNAALVQTESGYGLIDEEGKFIIPADKKVAENIGNGYFMFGDSLLAAKTVYKSDGSVVAEDIIKANGWFGQYLNVETEHETRFIHVQNGLVNDVKMANCSDAVYYGSRIAVPTVSGIDYYDANGNLLESYGAVFALGENCNMSVSREAPDAYLEISYPEIKTDNGSLQETFAAISARLRENALADYASLYRDTDGSVNYLVQGSFDYAVAGSVATVLQKTRFIENDVDLEYEAVCFDTASGEIYNFSSLFLPDVNWRTDLKDLLVDAYIRQCPDISREVNRDVVAVLGEKLDRDIGFLLESGGMVLYIPVGDSAEEIFLSYDDLQQYIDKNSELWLHMMSGDAQK